MHPLLLLILSTKALAVVLIVRGVLAALESIAIVGWAFVRSSEPPWRWPWAWLVEHAPPIMWTNFLLAAALLFFGRGLMRIVWPARRVVCTACGWDQRRGPVCVDCGEPLRDTATPGDVPFSERAVLSVVIRGLALLVLLTEVKSWADTAAGSLYMIWRTPSYWDVVREFIALGTLRCGLMIAIAVLLIRSAPRIANGLCGSRRQVREAHP